MRVAITVPAGERVREASLYANGKRIAHLVGDRRSSVLVQVPATGTLRIRLVVWTVSGHRYDTVRRYRIC